MDTVNHEQASVTSILYSREIINTFPASAKTLEIDNCFFNAQSTVKVTSGQSKTLKVQVFLDDV